MLSTMTDNSGVNGSEVDVGEERRGRKDGRKKSFRISRKKSFRTSRKKSFGILSGPTD